MSRYELRENLENDLRGDCICDYITKTEMCEILDDFDYWLETAKSGDVYYYGGNTYKLNVEYELVIWKNSDVRNSGEPLYADPISSKTDLEAIKREVEKYDIESTGCIEIFEVDEDEPILHYENGKWSEVE